MDELDWETRALNAEDLLCSLICHAKEAEEGGAVIPRFLVTQALSLVPDWGQRHTRSLERSAQARALGTYETAEAALAELRARPGLTSAPSRDTLTDDEPSEPPHTP